MNIPAGTMQTRLGGAVIVAAAVGIGGIAKAQKPDENLPPGPLSEHIKAIEDRLNAPDTFRAYWKDGFRLETLDKSVELRIGGRVHFDSEWNDTDNSLEASKRYSGAAGDATQTTTLGPFEDGWEIRRARLYLSAKLYQHVEFKTQYDFAKGATQEKDVYAGLYDLGDWVPNVRTGHQFEPFGLETLTSDNDLTFVEFNPISDSLAPFRNPGFLLWKNLQIDGTPRLTWASGLFRTDSNDNGASSGDGAYNLDARITGTPIWKDKGGELLHVGLAVSRREIAGRGAGQTVTLSSKPAADLLPVVITTGAIPADTEWKYGLESELIWGPVSFQSEYMLDKVETSSGTAFANPTFHGWYGQLSWVLTGETRRWNAVEAVPTTPRPGVNAFQAGGLGAWEVALRASGLDLSDGSTGTGGIEGGSLEELTAGLNWYPNPNTRVMWNLSHVDVNVDDPALGAGGATNILEMRVQVSF